MIVLEWWFMGMRCAIRHGAFGCPCGYVMIPDGHPWRGMKESELDSLVDVHGGVTFLGELHELADGSLWVGFDMAHAGDLDGLVPIRTDEGCAEETERLAAQIAVAVACMAGGDDL